MWSFVISLSTSKPLISHDNSSPSPGGYAAEPYMEEGIRVERIQNATLRKANLNVSGLFSPHG